MRDKPIDTEGRLVVIRGWGWENEQKLLNGKRFYFGMVEMCGTR